MTTKDLWRMIGLLFSLWLVYTIGTSILSMFLSWMPFEQGHTVAGAVMFVLCLICFIQEIKKKMRQNSRKQPASSSLHTNSKPKASKPHKTPAKPKVPTPSRKVPSVFDEDLKTLSLQVRRMDQKLSQLDQKLAEQFESSSFSKQKFLTVVDEANELFKKNCISIKERIELFDDLGYQQLVSSHQEFSKNAVPYQKSFQYVKEKLAQNENLINQINSLLIEVSQIDEQATKDQDEQILQELNQLIEQTRLYSRS